MAFSFRVEFIVITDFIIINYDKPVVTLYIQCDLLKYFNRIPSFFNY